MSTNSGRGEIYFTDGTILDGDYTTLSRRSGSYSLIFVTSDLSKIALNKEIEKFVSITEDVAIIKPKIKIGHVKITGEGQTITCVYIL